MAQRQLPRISQGTDRTIWGRTDAQEHKCLPDGIRHCHALVSSVRGHPSSHFHFRRLLKARGKFILGRYKVVGPYSFAPNNTMRVILLLNSYSR